MVYINKNCWSIYEQEQYETYHNNFLRNNEIDLNNLKNYFIPGKLYQLLTSIPIYSSEINFLERKWDWIEPSSQTDKQKSITPIMMFITIVNSYDSYAPLIQTQRAMSKALCLQFLKGSNLIYVPMIPGKEKKIFSTCI